MYANTIGQVGEFNEEKFKNTTLSSEEEHWFDNYAYTSVKAQEKEIVEALIRMDSSSDAVEANKIVVDIGGIESCCSLL